MKRLQFFLYVFSLLVFFINSIIYWGNFNDGMMLDQGLLKVSSLLVVLVAIFIIVLKKYFFKNGIHLVCTLWLILMPFIILKNGGSIGDLCLTILWPLIFESTYLLTYGKLERIKVIQKLFFVLWIIGCYFFLTSRLSDISSQTNTIYYALLQLPLFLCIKDKKKQFIILAIFSILAIISIKRSCILMILCIWAMYGANYVFRSTLKDKFKSIVIVVLISILGICAFFFVDSRMGGGVSNRLEETASDDTGNGRTTIYEITILMQLTSSVDEWIFGHGHYGVWKDSPSEISAHNDFLEVMYDYGCIIFFLYLCLWGYVIKRLIYLYRRQSPYLLAYMASFAIFFVMSMVSHLVLYTSYFNLLIIFWAFIEAQIKTEYKIKDERTVCNKRLPV